VIKSIEFLNFKALRNTTLPLNRFTLIVGPNGSGKSTATEAFRFALHPDRYEFNKIISAGLEGRSDRAVEVSISWHEDGEDIVTRAGFRQTGNRIDVFGPEHRKTDGVIATRFTQVLQDILASFRIFSFEAKAIAAAVQTRPRPELGQDGSNLAAVLDALRDSHPERFEELNRELQRWLPEFDRILFETPAPGEKNFLVRTSVGHHKFHPQDLSQGVLFALAFLAVAYLPKPPSIVCFEEPDHGIHPRLLREIRDAMYRLAFPEEYAEKRQPVQVIATTHSPYLLDLYKEYPEQIVIAHKDEQGAHFERLSEKPHITELLEGAPLGDIWFSGILGGVPSSP